MIAAKLERQLAALAYALAGRGRVTPAERRLIETGAGAKLEQAAQIAKHIRAGGDPLGDMFCTLRSPDTRREVGAVYTPPHIVNTMIKWAVAEGAPARVVDAGAGSGRYLVAAAARFPRARLIGIDTDPLATLLLRANARVHGFADRLRVVLIDYRTASLPPIAGKTLFIGNPPYVRHHDIKPQWKTWFAQAAARYGLPASKLSGLHIHFFLRTMQLARRGDVGCFITSAEWLDVNYGSLLRKLLADGLGGAALHVLDAAAMPFADTATTGAITCFRVRNRPKSLTVRAVARLEDLKSLGKGRAVPWNTVERSNKWSLIIRPTAPPPAGYIELGELVRVHRGQVTGANDVWIAGEHAVALPAQYRLPAITKARDLLNAGDRLTSAAHLRRVIDLPIDLDKIRAEDRPAVDRFLAWAKGQGAHKGYIARARRAWWAVGLHEPPPMMCTYMARRAPAFVRNLCGARLLNIAHGLYPRGDLTETQITGLLGYLRSHVRVEAGRTYAGGLTKFEPKELERIPLPRLDNMSVETADTDARASHG